jgi:N-succinyldiaminopimelate aminotransferase
VAFTSLSKRSNVPGLRSGFVMGDAALMKAFLLYRTYHGSAMSPVVQAASIAAWGNEAHVVDNRAQYRAKFAEVTPILAEVMDVALPDAGFYLWAKVPGPAVVDGIDSDAAFARDLLAAYNVTVLPGSYLARETADAANPAGSLNPGRQRIRMALVAETAECAEAARRIVQFVKARAAKG